MKNRNLIVGMIVVFASVVSIGQRSAQAQCYELIMGLPCCAYTLVVLPCIEGCQAPGGGPCCSIVISDPNTDIMQFGGPGWTSANMPWPVCAPLPTCLYKAPTCPGGVCKWPGATLPRACLCHTTPTAASDC